MTTSTIRAEWERHGAVMLAWPHSRTDWAYMLDEVRQCYNDIVKALIQVGEKVIILAPEDEAPTFDNPDVYVIHVETNDTWIRDYGPLSTADSLLDFRFNAWGQKFASNFDNQTTRKLADRGVFSAPVICHKNFVLEGGSIESDGNGTIMTTTCCLLAPNRNEPMTKQAIEKELLKRLGARKILWLNCEPLVGDDTDGHVDTLARLAPCNSIFYCGTVDPAELAGLSNAQGEPYNLFELPLPDPIKDPDDGTLLPATYANYLVTERAVLMPTYGQPMNDLRARQTLQIVYNDREIIGIDCRTLIRQHGSLHCATMQVPQQFFPFL
ncbi:MAG: agmatine deiminase family protein [Bacteroides sp.]|nr:agmatine deiminase family protein [Bacteroides sp.]MCM1380106.1 agmatine deiminase family protein [Bacteroides sp.]MCM1445661.1 agmatine deiminase family protein [Prevotella sp.]